MNAHLVMTLIGPDRTGLVDSLATIVTEHGGNWLQSSMSRLGGQFAGILRIEVPSENEGKLIDALKRLESQGLKVTAHIDRTAAAAQHKKLTVLEIVGQDRPGIVRHISKALAQHGVNVEELNTEIGSAPMSGETLFKAQATVHIPEQCRIDDLRKELQKIAQDLLVDVSLKEFNGRH